MLKVQLRKVESISEIHGWPLPSFAFVGSEKSLAKLFASKHVNQEVGSRIDAGKQVSQAENRNALLYLVFQGKQTFSALFSGSQLHFKPDV